MQTYLSQNEFEELDDFIRKKTLANTQIVLNEQVYLDHVKRKFNPKWTELMKAYQRCDSD